VEQLNTYASIIDSPVSVIYSADELVDAVKQYKDYDLIMVDTAGRSHKSEDQMDELGAMLTKAKSLYDEFDSKIYLVLSITTKYKDLVDITERYKDINDWSIVFTKLDETCALGNILNIRMLTGASLSYTTSGQNVPNDIELINEQSLAKLLLGGNT
jgi:flagellar biosynthesis protein FlhF